MSQNYILHVTIDINYMKHSIVSLKMFGFTICQDLKESKTVQNDIFQVASNIDPIKHPIIMIFGTQK